MKKIFIAILLTVVCIAFAGYIHGHYVAATAMLALAGGALGFLPYNFNPAKTFMGDCGSQFLGYCLATFALVQPVKSATIMAIALPVMVMGIPIFDICFAFLPLTFSVFLFLGTMIIGGRRAKLELKRRFHF